MATFYKSTVSTTVSLEGRITTRAGFSKPLFLAIHNIGTARNLSITAASELLELGFSVGSPAYQFASLAFAGRQAPSIMRIGRMLPDSYTVQVDDDLIEDDIVSVNMKLAGVAASFAYTVLAADTDLQAWGDGLAALIAADGGITSATSDVDGLITVVPTSLTDTTSFGIGINTTIYTTTTETIPDVMALIKEETEDYAMISGELHDTVSQEAFALFNESNDSLFIYSTKDTETLDPVSILDTMYSLKDKEYEYLTGMYSAGADKYFPEGALIGSWADQDPSYIFTANLQSLKGISTDDLTSGELISLAGKNGNWYVTEQGVGVFHEGFTPSGDFIDRVRFALWVKLRSNESMFNTLKRSSDRSSGLAYNDIGIDILSANLRTDVINVGIRNGAILTGYSVDSENNTIDYNPIITTNTRANQTNAAIAARLWEGFTVELVYNSSIHHIDNKTYIVNNRTAG